MASGNVIELKKIIDDYEDDYIVEERGTNIIDKKSNMEFISEEHLRNIEKLRKEGQLIRPSDLCTFR